MLNSLNAHTIKAMARRGINPWMNQTSGPKHLRLGFTHGPADFHPGGVFHSNPAGGHGGSLKVPSRKSNRPGLTPGLTLGNSSTSKGKIRTSGGYGRKVHYRGTKQLRPLHVSRNKVAMVGAGAAAIGGGAYALHKFKQRRNTDRGTSIRKGRR